LTDEYSDWKKYSVGLTRLFGMIFKGNQNCRFGPLTSKRNQVAMTLIHILTNCSTQN